MWGGAQPLLPLLVLSAVVSCCGALGVAGASSEAEDSQLKVGRSIDIFTRYGYLSLSMKVVPRNDSEWIFREPTIDIFTDADLYAFQPNQRSGRKQRRVFDGDFHMEFCDNTKQLVQAYFRDFDFELLDQPWKAFTSSWSVETLSRYLGINSSFIAKEHCYVLVRLSRFRDSSRLARTPSNLKVVEPVQREIDDIVVGDVASVLTFIKKFGSHYIQSYVTGNSLYQVFVFNKSSYRQIKDRLKNQGISNITEMELNQYFSPWNAELVGSIKAASGNQTVENWASSRLRANYLFGSFPSLLKSKGDPRLLGKLNSLLKNEAILQMEMRTLSSAIQDPSKRKWFVEVLDNFLKLWESNL